MLCNTCLAMATAATIIGTVLYGWLGWGRVGAIFVMFAIWMLYRSFYGCTTLRSSSGRTGN